MKITIRSHEVGAYTGSDAQFLDVIHSQDIPVDVHYSGAMDAHLPDGSVVRVHDGSGPRYYCSAIVGTLTAYRGTDIWRDVINELLTAAERRAAEHSGRTDQFEHAGYRFRRHGPRTWTADDTWFATISRGASVEATYRAWTEDAVMEQVAGWCRRHDMHPTKPSVNPTHDDYLDAAEAAGVDIVITIGATAVVLPARTADSPVLSHAPGRPADGERQ